MSRSLRTRLIWLLILLAAAATASGFIMLALFQQSATAQVAATAGMAARACDALADAQARSHAPGDLADEAARRRLSAITSAVLREKPGVEGGLWRPQGAFAYAFPSYEGSGPKTDIPEAELPQIVATSEQARRDGRLRQTHIDGGSQVLLITACPLPAPGVDLTAWTLTRVHSLAGRTYWQLMSGLAILVLSVGMAALMALALIRTWSRHVDAIVGALASRRDELPALATTGERELDLIVNALNDARAKLNASRAEAERLARQVSHGERLAALGRVTAGVAHAFRNPLAAMRLRAETALHGAPERRDRALELVVAEVDRLDRIVQRLLATTGRDAPERQRVALRPFLDACLEPFRAAAAARGVSLNVRCEAESGEFAPEPISLALSNLLLNALQEDAPLCVCLSAQIAGGALTLAVGDGGAGPPEAIRDHLFEPFVSGRADRDGLGLAIVREIAQAHGGRAEFERRDGENLFRIVLPCPAS